MQTVAQAIPVTEHLISRSVNKHLLYKKAVFLRTAFLFVFVGQPLALPVGKRALAMDRIKTP